MDIIITEKDIDYITKSLMEFYSKLKGIDDFYLEKKKEKILDIKQGHLVDQMFCDYTINPSDMNFKLVEVNPKFFRESTQIICTLPLEPQIGRQISLGILETNTNKYVGFIRLSSPAISIKPRNEMFGVLNGKQVNKFIINGSIITPVQPFGYNYLGGKLLALICCSNEMREMLNDKYEKSEVCIFETTSLYGDLTDLSQYDGLKPFIRYKGKTESKNLLFPIDEVYKPLLKMVRKDFGLEEFNGRLVDNVRPSPKLREFNKFMSIIKNHLKHYNTDKFEIFDGFSKNMMSNKSRKRYYYCDYGYTNILNHIENEEPLIKGQNYDKHNLDNIFNWWKIKAQKRFDKLKSEDKVMFDIEVHNLDTIENRSIKIIR